MLRRGFLFFVASCIFVSILSVAGATLAQVAHLITSEAIIDKDTKQISVLLAFAYPFAQRGIDMERPQMLAAIRIPSKTSSAQSKDNGDSKVERIDLLGDLEEIVYLNKKAWALKMPVAQSGVYQLIMETKPFWDEEEGIFTQQFAKTIFPVQNTRDGWEVPAGLKIEVLPLSRPYGLTAPAFFGGRIDLNGKPLANSMVKIERLNVEKRSAPNQYYESDYVRTDAAGNFYCLCPTPGWWSVSASAYGDPLKGPDGQPKQVEINGVLWFLVGDGKPVGKTKK